MDVNEKLHKLWTYDAKVAFNKLMEDEKKSQPENVEFLNGVQSSGFFESLFIRGFTAGMYYQFKNKNTKYVMDDNNF